MTVAELYPRFFDTLARYCAAMTGDSGEDTAQEAFLRAMGDGRFAALHEAQQKSFLYKTARRIVIDAARREQAAPQLPDAGSWQDDLTAVQVAQALDVLPPEQRRLVCLRYFSGYDSTAIGRVLGLPPRHRAHPPARRSQAAAPRLSGRRALMKRKPIKKIFWQSGKPAPAPRDAELSALWSAWRAARGLPAAD